MKKLLVVAVVVAAGWIAYAKVLRPAPKRACAHLHDLCNSQTRDDDASCTDFFDAIRDNGGSDAADKTATCVLDARTCPEAIGCAAGGAVHLATGAAHGFMSGFERSMK